MQRDLRETPLYREAYALHESFRQPGTGSISDASEVHVSPDGRYAVFAGAILEKLEGTPTTRICRTELSSGDTRKLTVGPGQDRFPRYSPDGRYIAFLSDRHRSADFQLHLLDTLRGATRSGPHVTGWVEYLQWSPDGQRILLGVAGHGADLSSGQGAVTTQRSGAEMPSWMPEVDTGDDCHRWRRAWVYELATGLAHPVSPADLNIWEAVWCGNEALAAIVSPGAGEGLWYSATLQLLDLESGTHRELYKSPAQLGVLSASPSGEYIAIVEAICSDRGYVAGDLKRIDTGSATVTSVDTNGVDITCAQWRSDRELLVAGHSGFDTVVGTHRPPEAGLEELWRSREITGSGPYITVTPCPEIPACVLLGEGYRRAPELALIHAGSYRVVKSFDQGYGTRAGAIAAIEPLTWKASDGLEIQGWLLRPRGPPPYPLIMQIHGGPVWHWRPTALRGWRDVPLLMLLERGYAIFLPNPRGSTGRGQSFVRPVLGDMGGADTLDYLSGLDHLVERGLAHPKRLGVAGVSYGGFMASWLVTQDPRFAAAIPVAPFTNHVTEHLLSNIPHFVSLFLADHYTNVAGRYFQRSPIMYAERVRTPTLNICGALDRSTPPEEAVQFHNALLENGSTKSLLITYPQEGHGIRKWPAAIDYAARVVTWFEEHLALRS